VPARPGLDEARLRINVSFDVIVVNVNPPGCTHEIEKKAPAAGAPSHAIGHPGATGLARMSRE
jgi:hypothetical protein